MEEKLKIDIVSDVVCPWCTIGYKRLEKAVEELGLQNQVEIEWQPFELNPLMPREGQNVGEHLAEKYGSTLLQQKEAQQMLVDAGAELGFTFDYFDEMRMSNTFEAHILLEYAKKHGKQTELKMNLTTAFFSRRKDVSDRKVLKKALLEVGLNVEDGMSKLDNENAQNEVKSKESYWKSLGIRSVPSFIFNKKSAIVGAQSIDILKGALIDFTQA